MPFIGQDWRSPGSIWVRTSSGWQTMSVVAELNRQIKKFKRERIAVNAKPQSSQNSGGNGTLAKGSGPKNYLFAPRSFRHAGKILTPGDILCSFDFRSALRDRRKFCYICQVLDIIIENYFTSLSGSAFNALFSAFEEAVDLAKCRQLFINRIQGILTRALEQMKQNNGGEIVGNRFTYNCRLHILDSWVKELGSIELVQREEDGKPTLMDLPVECQRLIFRCLADPADVIHLSQTCRQLNIIGSDYMLWEQLFWYHFTEAHLPAVPAEECDRDWKTGFRRLRKHHLLREEYVPMMVRCCHCNCVYWLGIKHPCPSETPKESEKDLALEYKDVQVEVLSPSEFMSIVKAP